MSSPLVIAFVVALGIGTFAWTKLSRGTGNADPKKLVINAAFIAVIAFIFLYTLLAWVLNIG
jgi:hypothetical protein